MLGMVLLQTAVTLLVVRWLTKGLKRSYKLKAIFSDIEEAVAPISNNSKLEYFYHFNKPLSAEPQNGHKFLQWIMWNFTYPSFFLGLEGSECA